MRPVSEIERRLFRQAVGARVRTLRARHGWSQDDLADRAGLHRTFVAAMERGQRGMNYDRLPDLAMALEVEPYALIPGWEAFTGPEPRDSWSVALGLAMPEHARHDYNQRRLRELLEETERRVGPVPEEVANAVDAEWRAALAAAGDANDEG